MARHYRPTHVQRMRAGAAIKLAARDAIVDNRPVRRREAWQ